MVAAFRDDPRDPQLPFQARTQQSRQGSSTPSFDYADPMVSQPSVQINPPIRPGLSRGAIAVSHLAPQPQHSIQPHLSSSQYGRPSQYSRQYGAIRPTSAHLTSNPAASTQVSLVRAPLRSTTPQLAAIQPRRSQNAMVPLPKPAPYAPWVQWLMVGQKGICLLTLTLVGCALSLYGQSVYQHRQWGQSYVQLEQLQKLEQQGIAASEIMKQSLAEEAERPTSHMSSQMPSKAISIETAPVRALDNTAVPPKSVLDMDLDGPMGY